MTSCIIVSHTHWDREWYRPFEAFRARLVDTVDLVLDQLASDPGWSFVLDGQTIVIEDYLEVRPERRGELEAACRAGRIAIGPWYVQPDSLLPAGETHIRNLLEGRRVGETLGPVSTVGYTPDSFGHPGQLPQILAGFGIGSFVYWRGNGAELERLPPVWRWLAPDGSSVVACLLGEGYFAAAYLGGDAEVAARRLETLATKLAHPDVPEVLLMNGIDHAPPDPHTREVAAALEKLTGWSVRRGLLDDHVATIEAQCQHAAEFTGELVGGRIANLLPGVWSTRTYLKQRNRTAEAELTGWAEPWAALASAVGAGRGERASLRTAWRGLLCNQAHDSICGCSTDAVHEHMLTRYDNTIGLARETTARALERLSGLDPARSVEWRDGTDVAVWNPSPHPRTDVVRFALDAHPVFMIGSPGDEIHPVVLASLTSQGMTIDGAPARVVESEDDGRVRLTPEQKAWDVEWIANDVPAFGHKRYRLAPGPACPAQRDAGRHIERDGIAVDVADDGTLRVTVGDRQWSGLVAVEDHGDRGDSYDFDPVGGGVVAPASIEVERCRYGTGVDELVVRRVFDLPASLDATRSARSETVAAVAVDMIVRLAPGIDRVDVDVTIENTARDHRLRLLFPTGSDDARAASTFDVVPRTPQEVDDDGWMQPAVTTFAVQGWVSAGGLTIGAPDLREAEVLDGGVVALTLVRAVGWISQMDLRTRPIPAGPGMPAPGAQCLARFSTRLHLWGADEPDARGAELGLRAVAAGRAPVVPAGLPLLSLAPTSLVLCAVKPAEAGAAIIVRVLNVDDAPTDAVLRFASAIAGARRIRLDESPDGGEANVDGATVTFPVGPHELATVAVELRQDQIG
ncbi:MAG: glycoside hydrolase family 38 N-terminal domain-containing protein [Acidimicrobiales bacterium]